MASLDLSDLQPDFASRLARFRAALDQAGIGYHVESGYRTPEQQSEIYARSHQGQDFPAAPPWRSFHNYGLAADVIPNNPADYPRMWSMAPQSGLYPLPGDKPHFQLPGQLGDLVNQYHLANWRPASMPAPAQGAIAYDAPLGRPSRPGAATPGTTLYSSPLDIVLNAESGDRNINNTTRMTSSGQAQGNAQITTGTWNDFAPKAGVDLKQYPTPDSAPRNIQIQVANTIPLNRWASSTVNAVLAKYPGIDTSQTLGAIQSAALGNSTGSPQTVAQGPPGVPGTGGASGGLAGVLPGFTANSPGAKMSAEGLKGLLGGGGGGQTPQAPPPPPAPADLAPQAMGGPMMAQPGQQNMRPRMQAQNYPAEIAGLMGGARPPVAAAPVGTATGMPGIAGTTLNSPSQLQMALMTGNISPYDIYAGLGGGGGFGSF